MTRTEIHIRVAEIKLATGAGECWAARRRSLQHRLAYDFIEAVSNGAVKGDLKAASDLVLNGLSIGEGR